VQRKAKNRVYILISILLVSVLLFWRYIERPGSLAQLESERRQSQQQYRQWASAKMLSLLSRIEEPTDSESRRELSDRKSSPLVSKYAGESLTLNAAEKAACDEKQRLWDRTSPEQRAAYFSQTSEFVSRQDLHVLERFHRGSYGSTLHSSRLI